MTDTSLPVAILAAAGFEESHLTEVQKALLSHGIESKVISPDGGLIQGWHDGGWGHHFMADSDLSEILSADYSALVIPAGSRSTATLVQKPHASRLIKAFLDAEKPVGVLGDAAKLLVAADVAGGRSVASDAETREELSRAGATIAGEEIIVDATLISVPASVAIGEFLDVLLEALVGDDDVERAA